MCNTKEEASPTNTVLISLDILTSDNINQHIFATARQKNPNHSDALEKDIVIP